MTKPEAWEYLHEVHYVSQSDTNAIVRLRKSTIIFPEEDVFGNRRDENDWAYIDTATKVDTGEYGEIMYFKDMKQGWIAER